MKEVGKIGKNKTWCLRKIHVNYRRFHVWKPIKRKTDVFTGFAIFSLVLINRKKEGVDFFQSFPRVSTNLVSTSVLRAQKIIRF